MSYTTRPPAPVLVAAGGFALFALWQLATKALPAFFSGSPEALSELLNIGLSAALIWGLLTLRRWAWWLGVISSAVGVALPLVVLGGFEEAQLHAVLPEPEAVIRYLTMVGALSAIVFVSLMLRSAREVFD